MPPRIMKEKERLGRTFIREWRKHRNLSQDRLVDRMREYLLTFSKSTLSRLENGKQPYSQPILEALSLSLACEPADLLMRDPKSPIWSILDTLRTLSPTDQASVVKIVETFKKAA